MDYTRLASLATRLIAANGAPATLTRGTNPEYVANTSEVESTPQSWLGRAVRVEYALRDIDNDTIRFGDVRLYMSVAGIPQPETGDRITFDGEIWHVVRCSPIKPSTIAVCYDVQVRK